ncbi:unnamed protein product [Didymodactylos carnosus]|uniref:Uncharacterized protein n=1 Tax=Didymodactylos carnosus TaxID=1234261 RepID=A0A813YRZ7_9BILA|nr:unnamed protein product [Didymodactylos carnosus]CAF0888884.1 unnamed protein product [Didymodactylos carnosus]CAF3636788.1 unnamed protein product [Didymodactylos carnosus]CAF3673610.1 unnamed protein product [Didymodactylos carnosus]
MFPVVLHWLVDGSYISQVAVADDPVLPPVTRTVPEFNRVPQTTVKFEEHLNNRQIYYIKTLQDVMIRPLSAKVIQATTTVPQVTTAIFTPLSRVMDKQHVVVPHALLFVNHNITPVSLLNTTKSAKTIVKARI